MPDHDQDASLLQASADGLSDAAEDAAEKARAAAQAVKRGVAIGAYRSAYGLSFGVVFAGVFLVELLPADAAARRGLEDGAEAALDAVATRRVRNARQTQAQARRLVATPAPHRVRRVQPVTAAAT